MKGNCRHQWLFNCIKADQILVNPNSFSSRPDALGNTNHNTNHKCTTGIATSGTYQTVNLPSGPARVLVLNVVAPVSRENYVFNTVASLYFGEGDIRTGEIFVSAIVSNKNGLDSRQQFPLLSVCTDGEFSVRGTSTYDDVD